MLGEDEDLGLDTDLPSMSKDDPDEDGGEKENIPSSGDKNDDDADIVMEYGLEDYDNEGY